MPNPFAWPFRAQFAAGFAVCAGLLAYAYFVQFQMGIEPCPLCIFQRIAFIVMGLIFLVGALHAPRGGGRRAYALLVLLAGLAGIGIAARHLWEQHLPPDPFAACAPGWNYMISNFPLGKTLRMAFTGPGDCHKVTWALFGLSMPGWTLICYVLLNLGALWAGFRHPRRA